MGNQVPVRSTLAFHQEQIVQRLNSMRWKYESLEAKKQRLQETLNELLPEAKKFEGYVRELKNREERDKNREERDAEYVRESLSLS